LLRRTSMSRFFLAASLLLLVKPSDRANLAGFRTYRVRVLSLIAVGCLGLLPVQRAPAQPNDPQPVDAVTTMLSAFDKYPIVALGDLHGCQDLYDFIATLVRNPKFPNKVNDIVVEFGNALYQDIADRYVAGKEVDAGELRQVWRNHTNPIVF